MATTNLPETACPYCLCAVEPANAVMCPACGFAHHRECWDTLGGCAVEGCSKMVEVKKAEMTSTYWGETEKVCPMCAEKIPVAALQCPSCKASFTDMRPVAREDVLGKPDDPELKIYQTKAIWLLVFSLLAFTSPFALIIGWVWYSRNRAQIERASTTRALVIASFGICVAYLIMGVIGSLVYLAAH
ncbi:MAG TPA: RING finger protein [Candidatus Angelobacter sp.]